MLFLKKIMRNYYRILSRLVSFILVGSLLSALHAEAQSTSFVVVSSASFEGAGVPETHVASNGLSTLFPNGTADITTSAWQAATLTDPTQSWPLQSANGVKLEYKGFGAPVDQYKPCELLYTSPGQINFYYPGIGGFTTFRLTKSNGQTVEGNVNIGNIAVTTFTANSNGKGPILGRFIDPSNTTASQSPTFHYENGRAVNNLVPRSVGGKPSSLIFYVTGTGRVVKPNGAAPRSPVVSKVTIGGVEQKILSNDSSIYRGIEQVTIEVSSSTPVGDSLPVVIGTSLNDTREAPTISIGSARSLTARKSVLSSKKKRAVKKDKTRR